MSESNIFNRLMKEIDNIYGVCGLMGNIQAESGLVSTNMQNSYERKLGMTDETYTAAVDNGTYSNFCTDRVGYGLCQWTSAGRKTGLLNLAKATERSIGDEDMQLDWLIYELNTSYKNVLKVLKEATSVKEASDYVMTKFERPANQSAENLAKRSAKGEAFYQKYSDPGDNDTMKQILMTSNDCYKEGRTINPVGIVVHSTGANNKRISRYVQPDDGIIGVNTYHNDWNRPNVNKCVHAFIGIDKNGNVCTYQTLPWNMRCWGCGSGKKGSYNNSHIQFEICEDGLSDQTYFNSAFNAAAELCAFLMKKYPSIKIENVLSHHESYEKGYASGHADCDHWLKKFGKNMDWFRNLVKSKLGTVENPKPSEPSTFTPYLVRITANLLNVRSGAGTSYKINTTVKKGGVYTIVGENDGWGKLKSGAGWISLKYTERV